MGKIVEAQPVSVLQQGTRPGGWPTLQDRAQRNCEARVADGVDPACAGRDDDGGSLAFIGHIGPEALAAAALAVTLYLVSFTFGAGLVAPLIAALLTVAVIVARLEIAELFLDKSAKMPTQRSD